MIQSIIACPETLIDLVLNPGWNEDKDDLDVRQGTIIRLRELLESEQLILYVPPELITAIHLIVSVGNNNHTARYAVSQILKLRRGIPRVDCERILEQASLLIADQKGIELYDAVLPFYASLLKADAVIIGSSYQRLTQLVKEKRKDFPEANPRILRIETLTSYLLEHQSQETPISQWIHVYTPQQNIFRLPIASTPIDFAYAIHTDIGDQCIGAVVNDLPCALNEPLKEHDIVEIIKGGRAEPKEEWLTFAKTHYAKKKIERGLKRLWSRKGWRFTKQAFGNDIRAYRQKLELIAQNFKWTLNDLMAKVGSGDLSIEMLRSLIDSCDLKQVHEEAVCTNPEDLTVLGNGNMNWHLASCCIPLPGDEITGIIDIPNRTVRVHRSDCQNLDKVKPEKLCSPSWNCGHCSVQLLLFMIDQPDIFRPILDLIAEILNSRSSKPDLRNVHSSKDGTARAVVRLTISSRQDLDGIIERIKNMPGMLKIKVTKLNPINKYS